VVCNIGEINQVLLNLIVNSAQAIGDLVRGTLARGRITIRTSRDTDHVVIEIADTGAGIPEEFRAHLFDVFFTTKEVGRGTGQGLAIARAVVVEKHGGQLTFDSVVGTGTRFYIRIPIAGRVAATAA
jgi:signal transduction histidine kinase